MKAFFFGSPEFACPSLEALAEVAEIAVVVTQPDRPAGRGLALKPPAVKELALKRGWRVLQPSKLRDGALAQEILDQKIDVAVVVAYGRILPTEILAAPRSGCINVHASLLPRWRGAAPIQRAIAAGDEETGVCLMQLDEGMDTGPLYNCERTAIGKAENAGELMQRLAQIGAQLLKRDLLRIVSGELKAAAQNNALATLAPKLSAQEGHIDWRKSAEEIERLVRAMNPWPLASAQLAGNQLKVFSAALRQSANAKSPGTIEALDDEGIVVSTGKGSIVLKEVQQTGRRRMNAKDFVAGARLVVGMRFEGEQS